MTKLAEQLALMYKKQQDQDQAAAAAAVAAADRRGRGRGRGQQQWPPDLIRERDDGGDDVTRYSLSVLSETSDLLYHLIHTSDPYSMSV